MDVRTADEIEVTIKVDGRRFEGTLGESIMSAGGPFRWEVREEIAEAMLAGRQSGEFDCGGQHYSWYVAD